MPSLSRKPRIFSHDGWWFLDIEARNDILGLTQSALIAQAPDFDGICCFARKWHEWHESESEITHD